MIETALYSFWSKPYLEKNAFKTFAEFNNEYDFVLSWSMSVKLAKQNFKKVVFVTDTWAWENLFKDLKLPFDEVRLSLDNINHSTDIWSVSKAYAILEMDTPFLHIDSDAYLWKELPNHILNKPIVVQDTEGIVDRNQYTLYLGLEWDYNLYLKGFNKYLDASDLKNRDIFAYNCGVVGGTDVEFLKKWATEMIDVANMYDRLKTTDNYRNGYIVVWVEQSLLMLMSEYENIEVTKLLPHRNIIQDYYTHLMGSSKRDHSIMLKLDTKYEKLFGKLNFKKPSISKKYLDISKIFRIFGYNK